MKNLSLFILCAGIAACHPSDGCHSWTEGTVAFIYINDPFHLFSDEETDIILASCQEWEDATNGHIVCQLTNRSDIDNLITITPDSKKHIQEETGHGAVTNFSPFECGGDIIIPYDLNEEIFRLVLLHEIGHSLGLDHDHYGTIMYPAVGQPLPGIISGLIDKYPTEITCDDVCQFCEFNDCYCGDLPPCEKE